MALWDGVVAAYERPGIPEACLTLQDEFGQNTSLLLWAALTQPADPAVVARAAEAARSWDATALSPLRAVRRALKAACPPVADAAREGLREDVKAAELRAERLLVETLEALWAGPADGGALQAVTAASRASGRPAPDAALAALVAGVA
ncbi:TIGR02444 family protein [Phenylobacterium sp. LjRoot219]|uniref:TIGR02444 family protein n=1 Tax=Phenylobacterium sp. LjRoot219 TaxID=3342283 RepID=UPI003ECE7C5D